MKISLSWLKDYVPVSSSEEKFVEKLTMAGLEVEHTEAVKGDLIVEMEVTPNRADCLSVIGLAREVAAIFKKKLKVPFVGKIKTVKTKFPVSVEDKRACTHYVATLIEGVKINADQGFVQQRIGALGLRAINNVVDITNFCLLEQGQPLHAFDFDKIEGGKIIVRYAKPGEKITTIDGVERKLDSSVLVIADVKQAVAIAGIMGGKEAEVTEKTKNILLESAYFNPALIRRASRKLALSSDSCYRFERGVDKGNIALTAARAVSLILKEAGGKVTQRGEFLASKPSLPKPIAISAADVNNLLGTTFKISECRRILQSLGLTCRLKGSAALLATPPTFRPDLSSAVDLIEEIARVAGYDTIELAQPRIPVTFLAEEKTYFYKKAIRNFMIAQGLDENITYSMFNSAVLAKAAEGAQGIRISNPLSVDQELMRPTLLPSALGVAQTNINRGVKSFGFFEIGKIYQDGRERDTLYILLAGNQPFDWRGGKPSFVNYYDAKGAVENLLNRFGVKKVSFKNSDKKIFDQSAADVFIAGKEAGHLGQLAVEVLRNFDIKAEPVIFVQIDLECVYPHIAQMKKFEPIAAYPSIVRDISVAVSRDIGYETIEGDMLSCGRGILKSINFVEEYLGDRIPQGQRGLVFSLVYQHPERTLREEEIHPVHEDVLKVLTEKYKAVIR